MDVDPIIVPNEGGQRVEYAVQWDFKRGDRTFSLSTVGRDACETAIANPPRPDMVGTLVQRTITVTPWAPAAPRPLPRYMTEAEVAATMRMFYGVPVAWVGEEGDAVALGVPSQRAKAAFHRLGRADHQSPMYVAAIDIMWAWFERTPDDPESEWVMHACDAWTEGAMEVTIAHELTDYRPGERS